MMQGPNLVSTGPGQKPFYTEDGKTDLDPAVGYPHVMLASVCSNTPDANNASCLWSHKGIKSAEILDNE